MRLVAIMRTMLSLVQLSPWRPSTSGFRTPDSRRPAGRLNCGRPLPLAAALLLLAVAAGCGPSAPEPAQTADFVRDSLNGLPLPVAGKTVEVTKIESFGDPPRTRIAFRVDDELRESAYVPVTVEEACVRLGHDRDAFAAAVKTLGRLRMPERDELIEKLPPEVRFEDLYWRVAKQGDAVAWTGEVVAEYREGEWRFSNLKAEFPPEQTDARLEAASKLPKGAVRIDGPGSKNDFIERTAREQAFIKLAAEAERRVAERLEDEKIRLTEATKPGASWSFSLSMRDGPSVKLRATFVERSEDGERSTMLIVDPADPLQRGVWIGTLELAPAPEADGGKPRPRPTPDGWSLRLDLAPNSQAFPVGMPTKGLRIVPGGDGALRHADPTADLTLQPDSTPQKLVDVKQLGAQLREGTAPGQVWTGTFQHKDEASRRVRLTFLERRDEGGYVRAVLEEAESPFQPIVLQGVLGLTAGDLYGRPVRLKPVDASRNRQGALPIRDVQFVAALDGARSLQSEQLNLQPAEPIKDLQPARTRWKQAAAPGAVWKGKIQHVVPELKGTTGTFRFTIAEVRDDLGYVRVLVEGDKDSSQFRIYEGSVDQDDDSIDDFALVLRAKTTVRNHPGGIIVPWWSAFLGTRTDEESVHRFRLLPGGGMVGLSHIGEKIELTRDAEAVPPALDRASMVRLWREKLVAKSRWRGMLNNRPSGQKVEVELEVHSGPNDVDEVEIRVSMAKPKAIMGFRGTLRPDDDVKADGYALTLKKVAAGIGDSIVFGRVADVDLEFRLSPDGKRLLGVARRLDGPHPAWDEVLELEAVDAAPRTKP